MQQGQVMLVSYLSIIVGLVDQELLSTGRRSYTHGCGLGIITGMVTQVLASQPCLISVILEPLDEAVHADVDCVWSAVTTGGSLAKLHPPGRGKVGALSTVEPGVEARVVATGECDHYLSFMLDNLVGRFLHVRT